MPRSLLLVLEDELDDLTTLLDFLPELHMTARVIRDIAEPPGIRRSPGTADRIGKCASELFNQRVDEHLTPAGKAFAVLADRATPTDLAETAEMLTAVVQWRLYRLGALVRLAKADARNSRQGSSSSNL